MKKMLEAKDFQFSIFKLLTKNGNEINGPMATVLFAQEVAAAFGFEFNRIARVNLRGATVLQHNEDRSLTGYDHLIIGQQDDDNLWLSFWIDTGSTGIPVATCNQADKDCIITKVYRSQNFLINLTDDQIAAIFNHIFNNPDTIDIR